MRMHFRALGFYGIECAHKEVLVCRGSNVPMSVDAPEAAGYAEIPYATGPSNFDCMVARHFYNPWELEYSGPEMEGRRYPVLATSVSRQKLLATITQAQRREIITQCWHGFGLQRTTDGTESWLCVVTPLWPITTLAAVVSAGGWVPLIAHYSLRRRRVRAGLCPRCGYDLRATPFCCPECGKLGATAEPKLLT